MQTSIFNIPLVTGQCAPAQGRPYVERSTSPSFRSTTRVTLSRWIALCVFASTDLISLSRLPTRRIGIYLIRNYNSDIVFTKLLPASDFVTFVNHNNRHELPSLALLKVHVIIARILHATGKAEQAGKLKRDKDDIGARINL